MRLIKPAKAEGLTRAGLTGLTGAGARPQGRSMHPLHPYGMHGMQGRVRHFAERTLSQARFARRALLYGRFVKRFGAPSDGFGGFK